MVLNVKTNFSISNEGEIGRLVCIPCIPVGVNLNAGSYISHEENTESMQLEINRLRRRLHCERRRRTPLGSDPFSDDDRDGSYKPRLRTPHNQSFSCDEDHRYECRNKTHLAKV